MNDHEISNMLQSVLDANSSKHILHLYSPQCDKHAFHASFLGNKPGSLYVTETSPTTLIEKTGFSNVKLAAPSEAVETTKFKKIVYDFGSFQTPAKNASLRRLRRTIGLQAGGMAEATELEATEFLERKIPALLENGTKLLCAYDVTRLTRDDIKQLIDSHDKVILSTSTTVVSLQQETPCLDALHADRTLAGGVVKTDLETIILSLLAEAPLSGTALRKKIYEKFNTLVSAGTVYPLLHKLTTDGVLRCKHGIKTKRYTPSDPESLRELLTKRIHARQNLNLHLKSVLTPRS